MHGDDANEFAVLPNSLQPSVSYNFSVIITHKPTGNTVWRGHRVVLAKPKSTTEVLNITPYKG